MKETTIRTDANRDPITGAPGSKQAVFSKPAGMYQITQTGSNGWALSGLTCSATATASAFRA